MAKLFKRKNSLYWWIDYTYKGKRRRYSLKVTDKATALKIKAKIEAEIALESHDIKLPSPVKFPELVSEFLSWSRRNKKPSAHRRDKTSARILLDFFGSIDIKNITSQDIERFKEYRLSQGVLKQTINRDLSCLRKMLNLAIEWGYIKNRPKIKLFREPPGRLRFLSRDEISRLLDAAARSKSPYLLPAIMIALHTGMRKSEILSLRWRDIDFENNFIRIDTSKTGKRRLIPIHPELREYLLSLPRRGEYAIGGEKPVTDIKKAFQNACRKAGIKDFRFHDLRHTFASHLVMSGTPLHVVKELLGHKTLDMVQRYAHLSPDYLGKVMNAVTLMAHQKSQQSKSDGNK